MWIIYHLFHLTCALISSVSRKTSVSIISSYLIPVIASILNFCPLGCRRGGTLWYSYTCTQTAIFRCWWYAKLNLWVIQILVPLKWKLSDWKFFKMKTAVLVSLSCLSAWNIFAGLNITFYFFVFFFILYGWRLMLRSTHVPFELLQDILSVYDTNYTA